jgi:hypothetical protein
MEANIPQRCEIVTNVCVVSQLLASGRPFEEDLRHIIQHVYVNCDVKLVLDQVLTTFLLEGDLIDNILSPLIDMLATGIVNYNKKHSPLYLTSNVVRIGMLTRNLRIYQHI